MSERIEQAAEEAYGEAHEIKDEAKKIIQLSDIGFAEACESVLGGRESVSLPATAGGRCEIGPLSSLLAEKASFSNPIIDEAVKSVRERRVGIDEIMKEQGKAGLPERQILENTDWEALAGIVYEWTERHGESLVDLGIENIANISPLKAVLLASKIVNSSLEYDYIAGNYFEKLSKEERDGFRDREEFEATSESRLLTLDSSGVDAILMGGKGLCGHYAIANEAVYKIIKKMQEGTRLDGSALFSMPAIVALDVENHCYNALLIGTKEGGVQSGVLDPLWVNPDESALVGWMNSLDKFYTRMSSLVYFLAIHNVIDPFDKSTLASIENWMKSEPTIDYKIINSLACKGFMRFSAGGSDMLSQILNLDEEHEPELRVAIALYGLDLMSATANQVRSVPRLSDHYFQHLTESRSDREQLVDLLAGSEGVSGLDFEILSREHLSKMVILRSFKTLADPDDSGKETLEYEFGWGDGLPFVGASVAGYLSLKRFFSPGEKSLRYQEHFINLESAFLRNILHLVEHIKAEYTQWIEEGKKGELLDHMFAVVGDEEFENALDRNLRSLSGIVNLFDNQELKSRIENEIQNLLALIADRKESEK